MESIALTTPLVSVDWLSKHLDHPDILILDGSIKKAVQPDKKFNYNDMRIPKARFFDIKKIFSDHQTDIPNMFPSLETFQENCRKLGIRSTSILIVYDVLGIYSSPRVWWMFKTMGYDNIAVLDGGLPEWVNKGFTIEPKQKEEDISYGNFIANDRSKYKVDAHYVLSEMNSPKSKILDARSHDRFIGVAPEPRAGLKGGHMPKSLNLPYTKLLHEGKMLSKDKLNEIFSNLNLKDKRLIFTCGSGITACILFLAASIVSYEQMSVYDGSWSEWGQLDGAPISC